MTEDLAKQNCDPSTDMPPVASQERKPVSPALRNFIKYLAQLVVNDLLEEQKADQSNKANNFSEPAKGGRLRTDLRK